MSTIELLKIYQPILSDMGQVDDLITETLTCNTPTHLKQIIQYLLSVPGKRLRPALTVLMYRALTYEKEANSKELEQVFKLATSIELIHMASLIHDDVIDRATIRHNKPSINARYGTEISVPLGVYLYSDSLRLISSVGNIDALRCISHTVKAMCKGELLQVLERDNPRLMLKKYLVILKKKTGMLFSAACRCGALIARQSMAMQWRLRAFGSDLGLVFQIMDDYLDVMGDAEKLGKKPGQDFELGEVTLPILFLLESLPKEEREQLVDVILSKDSGALSDIQNRIKGSEHSISQTKNLAFFYLNRAKSNIESLPPSPYKDSLMSLLQFIKERGLK